jgi:F0F1-type ATP synthase assembly protein I
MAPIFPNGKDLGRYAALGQVGLEMVGPIGIGLAVDYYTGSGPWGVIIGTVVGFAGGLIHLVHLANKLNAEDSREDSSGPKTDTK